MSETQLHAPPTPLPRVPVPCTDDPPELENESDDDEHDYANVSFIESKQDKASLSLPPPMHERHNSRCNLRPPKPRHVAALCKQVTPSTPTTDTSQDLRFTPDITNKLNITCHDQNMMTDDNHLPVLDEHPTKLLSHWSQPSAPPTTTSKQTMNSANAVYDPISGTYLEYRELLKTSEKKVWQNSFSNELGRLSQGYKKNNIKGTNTLHFIPWSKLPKHKKPTHARMCCDFKPHKDEQHRTRITVGGDRLHYSGDTSTPTASITTTKMHINSTISTDSARYLTADIKDFYLNSDLEEYEYLFIDTNLIPPDFAQDYNLQPLSKNGKVLA